MLKSERKANEVKILMKVILRALLLIAVGLSAVSAFAQTKTVTNATLKKFSDERVQADRDLNENYERLGFSSPEERERRLEAWKRENDELSDRWARERRDQENADAMAAQAAALGQLNQPVQQPTYPNYNPNGIWGYGGGYDPYGYGFPNRYGYYRDRYGIHPIYPPSGSVSGGVFWPSPPVRRPYYRSGIPVWPIR